MYAFQTVHWDPYIEATGLEPLELEALVPIYEEALLADPEDLMALAYLGHAFTRTGRLEQGLEVDLRLTALVPKDSVARYNLACSYALLGRPGDAMDALEKAIGLGYREPGHMQSDEDLESLRDHPRFVDLLSRLEKMKSEE